MKEKNTRLNQSSILVLGVIALMEATGITFLAMLLLGITLCSANISSILIVLSVTTMTIWGVLLCRNC